MGAEKNIFSRAAKAGTSLHMQAFSRDHIVGPELFSKVISSRRLYIKLGAEKKKIIMLTFFSSSECPHDWTDLGAKIKLHSRLHNVM